MRSATRIGGTMPTRPSPPDILILLRLAATRQIDLRDLHILDAHFVRLLSIRETAKETKLDPRHVTRRLTRIKRLARVSTLFL